MVGGGKVFSEITSPVCRSGFPIYVELFFILSIDLDLRCLMVPVAMPNAFELST